MKKILFLSALMFLAATLPAKTLKKVTLYTGTQMHCQKCEKKVTENLRYVTGIKSIKADAPSQTITIVYDADKTTTDAMLKSLAKIKYTAEVKEVVDIKDEK
ncbi:MAG: heavy-metal-associated domain-containing protein [Bacteroidales bacterium]|nr:heavy-metal-associated domain-containing protein [Candidatus Liminaster caballi]